MASYKVIALSVHSDKVQHIFNSGDVITDEQLHEGQGPKLVADGFLEEISSEPPAPKTIIVTQEMLDINPELAEAGIKVDEVIELGPEVELSEEEIAQALKEVAEARKAAAAKKPAKPKK
jgi:hypothetical protein